MKCYIKFTIDINLISINIDYNLFLGWKCFDGIVIELQFFHISMNNMYMLIIFNY